MKRVLAVFGFTLSATLAAPALAATAAMPTGGLTVGGPGTATLAASATETLLSGMPSLDACATLTNAGTSSVDLTLIGSGTTSVTVPGRKTATLCKGSLQTVTATCLAVGTGTCAVSWRVDQLR